MPPRSGRLGSSYCLVIRNNMFIANMIVFLHVWIQGPHRGGPAPRPARRAALGHRTDRSVPDLQRFKLADTRKEIQMYSSNNVFVLGVTGQVGKLVAKNLKRSEVNFSVGTRRRASL